jgi:hypothetical protein
MDWVKKVLDHVPGVSVMERKEGLVIFAEDYKLIVERIAGMWRFQESKSDKPNRECHFDLRRQIHMVLNHG